MKIKQFLCSVLSALMLASSCFSVNAANITTDGGSQNTLVTYGMSESFLVTIPTDFTIDDSGKASADVSASDVMIADSAVLEVAISGRDYTNKWELIDIAEDDNRLEYTIGTSVGGRDIINNSVVLSVNAGEAFDSTVTETMHFTVVDELTKAGIYKDILTFKIAVVGGKSYIEGTGQTFNPSKPTALSFRSQQPVNEFKHVLLNNEIVDPDNYTVTEGSTIVTFKEEFLATLPLGNYKLSFVFENATASSGFKVAEEVNDGNDDVVISEIVTNYTQEDIDNSNGNLVAIGATDPLNVVAEYVGSKLRVTKNGSNSDGRIMDNAFNDEMAYKSTMENTVVDLIISEGITHIGDYAFANNISIENVTIADSVTSIGGGAFNLDPIGKTSKLKNIDLGNGVRTLGGSILGYTAVETLTIPEGVTSLSDWSLSYSLLLKTLNLPSTIKTIGMGALLECSSLKTINFNGSVEEWFAIEKYAGVPGEVPCWDDISGEYVVICTNGRVLKGETGKENEIYTYTRNQIENSNGKIVAVGATNELDVVGVYSDDWTTLTIMNNREDSDGKIKDYAFVYVEAPFPEVWSSLKPATTSIVINDGITEIGMSAFDGVTNLTDVVIPDSVTKISEGAFQYQKNLTRIHIGSGVKYIGTCAIETNSLVDIFYNGSENDWNNIYFGEAWDFSNVSGTGHYTINYLK